MTPIKQGLCFFIWLIYTCVFGVIVYTTECNYHVFQTIQEKDFTYISLGVFWWFVLTNFIIGLLCMMNDCKLAEKLMNFCWHSASQFTALGLLGTIAGFMYTLGNSKSISIETPEQAKQLMEMLSIGLGTGLITTIVGLTASILLRFECTVLAILRGWKN